MNLNIYRGGLAEKFCNLWLFHELGFCLFENILSESKVLRSELVSDIKFLRRNAFSIKL